MRVGIALTTCLLVLAGCGKPDRAVSLPEPPLPASAEDPFGDRLSAAAGRLEERVVNAVGTGHGKPQVRRYLVHNARLPERWRPWYDQKAAAAACKPLPELGRDLRAREHAFGYSCGTETFVVSWIEAGADMVGVTTIRVGDAA